PAGWRVTDRAAAIHQNEPFNPPCAAILELRGTGIELRLHRCRNPELKCVPDKGAVKPVGRDTDDGMRQTCEHLRLADDIRVAMKPVLQHLIAYKGNWMRIVTYVLEDFEADATHGFDYDFDSIVRG